MNNQDAKEMNELLFSFMGLFHEKFLIRYRQHDHDILGLKKNHFKILGMLSREEFLLSSELSRRLDIEKGSITTLIDQLVEKGLVIRRTDPEDRRKSQISLSKTGREEMHKLIDKHSREIQSYLQDMNDPEIQQFLDCVRYAVQFMNKL
ncbi:MAG: MarR family transcriptional regulator [Syntrophomonas sp.]